jgi:SAM-dependent methyltransferase
MQVQSINLNEPPTDTRETVSSITEDNERHNRADDWRSFIDKYTLAIRNVNECLKYHIDDQKIETELFDEETLEALGIVLESWEEASTKAYELSHTHPDERDVEEYRFWDSMLSRTSDGVYKLFVPLMTDTVRRLQTHDWKNTFRTDIADSLLNQPEFKQKGILTEYMAYMVWYAYRPITYQNYHDKARRDPISGKTPNEAEFENAKNTLRNVISHGLIETTKSGDREEVKKSLLLLYSGEAKDIADLALISEDFDDPARLQFAVDYINVFGLISCVEVLSPIAEKSPKIKKLFDTLHGREVQEMISSVDDLYDKSIDEFIHHYSPEVTAKETALTRRILLEEKNKKPEESTVIDLAAGYGRLTSKLVEESWGKVIAIEPHKQFLEMLAEVARGSNGRVRVVEGVWDNLADLGIGRTDIGICLGRSLPHANTMSKLVGALSQMTSVCNTWVVDYPDTSTGIYKENSDALHDSLVILGIDSEKASMLYDSSDGIHFCDRMVVNKEQMEILGELLGFTVKVVDEDLVGENKDVRNVYYLLQNDPNFNILNLCGDRLLALTAKLDLRRPGIDFNMYIPAWGMSLGQALILSHEEQGFRDVKIKATIRNNKLYGMPKVSVKYNADGVVFLEVNDIEHY